VEWHKSNAQAAPRGHTVHRILVLDSSRFDGGHKTLGDEFRRSQFEAGELEAGRDRAPDQRPRASTMRLLPGTSSRGNAHPRGAVQGREAQWLRRRRGLALAISY